METVTVFRLEDVRGGGCFAVAYMQDYTDAAVAAGLMTPEEEAVDHFHNAARGCPSPYRDEELQCALDERGFAVGSPGTHFGFPHLDVAREWFPPCMADALERNGQTLTVWEVATKDVAVSERQCVFLRDRATLVERLPVHALYAPPRQAELPLAA